MKKVILVLIVMSFYLSSCKNTSLENSEYNYENNNTSSQEAPFNGDIYSKETSELDVVEHEDELLNPNELSDKTPKNDPDQVRW